MLINFTEVPMGKQALRNSQENTENESPPGELALLNLETYYKTIIMVIVWLCRTGEQWNRTESTEIDLKPYGNLVYDKCDISNDWGWHHFFNKRS